MIYLVWGLVLTLGWWLPWWLLALLAAVIGVYSQSRWQAIGLGFLGFSIPWIGLCYFFDLQRQGLIGLRLAGMLGLSHSIWVYLLVGLVGGALASSAANFGFDLAKCFRSIRN